MNESTLTERAQWVLRQIVEAYIEQGQPVGSKAIADEAKSLSAATIRNVMADLEAKGYLHSPHVSAGRVPTEAAYRFFVNGIIKHTKLDDKTTICYEQVVNDETADGKFWAEKTSKLLAKLTNLASLVSTPKPKVLRLRHIEFLRISSNQILVILVLNQKEVQNRIIRVDRDYDERQLERLSNMINHNYSGLSLESTREKLIQLMRDSWQAMDQHMRAYLQIADTALQIDSLDDRYAVAGQINLMDKIDSEGVDTFHQLLETFSEHQEMLKLLDKCLDAKGVQIFIGSETHFKPLQHYSLIVAPYRTDAEMLGVIGVIGPTRMNYQKIIPIVDVTAKLLSTDLN